MHLFRRYGLHDGYTRFMNSLLLFVMLFYVYPLKFLFTLMIGQITNPEGIRLGHGLSQHFFHPASFRLVGRVTPPVIQRVHQRCA